MYALRQIAVSMEDVRDGFRFRGGHLALDLTATLLGRLRPVSNEFLKTPDDLRRWLSLSELKLVATYPSIAAGDASLQSARLLREAIYGSVMAVMNGKGHSQQALRLINEMAALPCAFPQIDDSGMMRMCGDVDAALSLIAQQANFLLGTDWIHRVRQCHGEFCTILFLDTSRKGDRRWCSMSACGNRAKIAEFRKRKRGKNGT